MKKFIILTLVGLMAFTGFSFADEPNVKPERERPTEFQRENTGDYREKFTGILETYSPELLATYITLWNQHDAIHVDLNTLKENYIANKELERAAFKAEIRALIQAKEITRPEVKLIIEEMKLENQTFRAEMKIQIDTLKASYDLSRENFKILNQELKTLITSEDNTAINGHLNTMLSYFENHLSFDLAKYELLLNQ